VDEKKFDSKDWEAEDRLGFIRKVYGILSVMLVTTAVMIAPGQLNEETRFWYQTNLLLGACLGFPIMIIIEIALLCCRGVARRVPTNYVLLAIFTLCQSISVAWICSFYPAEIVLTAAITTGVITMTLTAVAFTTKTDFTFCAGFLAIAAVGAVLIIVALFTVTFTEWWYPIFSYFLIICYGIFLIVDTQLIAGSGRYALETEDYIVGALLIYMDIIIIFLELLKAFSRK